jgi:hypothetical protein
LQGNFSKSIALLTCPIHEKITFLHQRDNCDNPLQLECKQLIEEARINHDPWQISRKIIEIKDRIKTLEATESDEKTLLYLFISHIDSLAFYSFNRDFKKEYDLNYLSVVVTLIFKMSLIPAPIPIAKTSFSPRFFEKLKKTPKAKLEKEVEEIKGKENEVGKLPKTKSVENFDLITEEGNCSLYQV